MYCPILRGKRHELSAIKHFTSLTVAHKCKPLLEPVNANLNELISAVEYLHGKGMVPFVVINPSLGEFAPNGSVIFQALQANPKSSGKFTPCVKIKNSFDAVSISLLQGMGGGAAAYLVSDISLAAVSILNSAACVFVNPSRVDGGIFSSLGRVVVYFDSFAKKSRNADYPMASFYSNLHVAYKGYPNAVGFADYTVLGEDFSLSGGPAYVVAIHLSYIERVHPYAMYVRHFCSTSQSTTPANPGGKFLEALDLLIAFDVANPGVFDNTWGLQQYRAYHVAHHNPGLGVVKELSIEHHIETICNFI